MYTLKPSVQIKADVPFQADFERVMRREMPRAYARNLSAAMRTAFRSR